MRAARVLALAAVLALSFSVCAQALSSSSIDTCVAPATTWWERWWRAFLSWFGDLPPECTGTELFVKRFFTLGNWADAGEREKLLTDLAAHTEIQDFKEDMVGVMKDWFTDVMAAVAMELDSKGLIDVTPLLSLLDDRTWPESPFAKNTATPTIIVPGVSSSCKGTLRFVTKYLKHYLNSDQVECIAKGDSATEQEALSWFSGGDDAIEHFRQRVLANPIYAEKGFNVIAFSQGNFITRGYVQQYNGMTIDGQVHPRAKSWIAMNGPVFGQGGIPTIDNLGWAGALLDHFAGLACDVPLLAGIITPCSYLRVPSRLGGAAYRSRLTAKMNGEDLGPSPSTAEAEAQESFLAQSKENINRLESFVAIKNKGDTVIKPLAAEWLGIYGDSFAEERHFKDTDFYKSDTFGFKSLDDAGKVHFLETPGELQHCIFSADDLKGWVDTFWMN